MDPEFVRSSPRIAYTGAGHGEPLIFLHGVGGGRHNWARQLQVFSSRYRCVAWDARGYGASERVHEPFPFAAFATDLERLLDHLDVVTCTLVGLSMGGRIALEFYSHAPDRVGGLVLCSCFPSFRHGPGGHARADFLRRRLDPIRAGGTLESIAPELVASLVGPTCSAEVTDALVASMGAVHPSTYAHALQASMGFDRWSLLSRISVPVTLIFGECDRLTPPSVGKLMQEQIPGSLLEVIADAGHVLNLEAPAHFEAALRRALSWGGRP